LKCVSTIKVKSITATREIKFKGGEGLKAQNGAQKMMSNKQEIKSEFLHDFFISSE
jgi:hypothetical protein